MRDVRQILADCSAKIRASYSDHPLADECMAWIAANPVEDPGDDPTAGAILCQQAQERQQMASKSIFDFFATHKVTTSDRQLWEAMLKAHGWDVLHAEVTSMSHSGYRPTAQDINERIGLDPDEKKKQELRIRFCHALIGWGFVGGKSTTEWWKLLGSRAGCKGFDERLAAIDWIGKKMKARSVSLKWPSDCVNLMDEYRLYMQDRAQMKGQTNAP